MDLPFPDISYQNPLWLFVPGFLSFTLMVSAVPPLCNMYQSFIWLDNIPFIPQIYHNLFIHSSVDKTLGYFHFWLCNTHTCKCRPQISHKEGDMRDKKESRGEGPSRESLLELSSLSDWLFVECLEGWVSLGVRLGICVHLTLRSGYSWTTISPVHSFWIFF